jgi:hypothetical protein
MEVDSYSPWCGSWHWRWKCQLTFLMLLQIKAVQWCRSCELAYHSLYLKRKFSVGCPVTWLPAAPTRNTDSTYRNNPLVRWNAFESLSDVCVVWPEEHKCWITHRLSSCFKQQPLILFLQSRLKNQAQRTATCFPIVSEWPIIIVIIIINQLVH